MAIKVDIAGAKSADVSHLHMEESVQICEASGISMGEKPPFTLTSKLFLDSEPEAKTSHRVSGLPLTGSERNATMADRR